MGRGAILNYARAEEILGLDVPDLDLPSKRGWVVSKGGSTDWVHWQTGTAQLLPRLLAGRREGPVFLTEDGTSTPLPPRLRPLPRTLRPARPRGRRPSRRPVRSGSAPSPA